MAANSQQLDNVRKLLQQRQTTQPTTGGAIDAVRQQLQARQTQPTEREQRIEQGVPVGLGERAKPTLVGGALRDIARPFARLGATANRPFVGALGTGPATLEEATIGSTLLGDVRPIPGPLDRAPEGQPGFLGTGMQGPGQAIGAGLEIGGTIAPVGTVGAIGKTGARTAGRTALQRIGQQATPFVRGQAISGAAAGSGMELQEEDATLRGVTQQGLLGLGAGAALGRGGEVLEPVLRGGTARAGQALSDLTSGARQRISSGAGSAAQLGEEGAGLGAELLLGTRIKEGLGFSAKNPRLVEKFNTGKRTINDVSTDLTSSTKGIAEKSIEDLKRVKADLPKFQLDEGSVRGDLRSIIDDTFVDTGRATKRVERLEQLIAEHDDFTPKGLLDLNTTIRRNNLHQRTAEDLVTSNRIIRDVQRKVKERATELVEDKRILNQLKESSDTITKLDDIGYAFKDKINARPDQMNKTLESLAKTIDDPNVAQERKVLMDFIKEKSGFDLELDLNAFRSFKNLSQDISQGDITSGIRQAAGRILAPVAIAGGKAAGALRQRLGRGKKPPTS